MIEASLTGHVVFSTMHTNSAAESVGRLLDLGLDPFNHGGTNVTFAAWVECGATWLFAGQYLGWAL